MPKPKKPCLLSSLPKIHDTFLVNRSLPDIIERARNVQSGPIYQGLVNSELLEATVFPASILCPELIIECANHYDPGTRCIKKISGEVVVRINRTSLCSALRIPHKELYEPYMFKEADKLYANKNKSYDSIVAQS